MTGFAKNDPKAQVEIGNAVAAARAQRPAAPWKDLEERFQRDRRTLWRYATEAAVLKTRVADKRTKLFHVKQMSHTRQESCADVSYETSALSTEAD